MSEYTYTVYTCTHVWIHTHIQEHPHTYTHADKPRDTHTWQNQSQPYTHTLTLKHSYTHSTHNGTPIIPRLTITSKNQQVDFIQPEQSMKLTPHPPRALRTGAHKNFVTVGHTKLLMSVSVWRIMRHLPVSLPHTPSLPFHSPPPPPLGREAFSNSAVLHFRLSVFAEMKPCTANHH